MYSLSEINNMARSGFKGTFINGAYTIIIEGTKVRIMSPSAWTITTLWDPIRIPPSDGWKLVKSSEEEDRELEKALEEDMRNH